MNKLIATGLLALTLAPLAGPAQAQQVEVRVGALWVQGQLASQHGEAREAAQAARPMVGAKKPAVQGTHEVEPVEGCALPRGHREQAALPADAEKEPGAHATHVPLVSGADPGLQTAQGCMKKAELEPQSTPRTMEELAEEKTRASPVMGLTEAPTAPTPAGGVMVRTRVPAAVLMTWTLPSESVAQSWAEPDWEPEAGTKATSTTLTPAKPCANKEEAKPVELTTTTPEDVPT